MTWRHTYFFFTEHLQRTHVASDISCNIQYQIQTVNAIWVEKYAMHNQIVIVHHKVEISSANHMYTSCLGLIRRSMHGPDIVIIFQRLMSYCISLLVETEIHKCAQTRAYTLGQKFTDRGKI